MALNLHKVDYRDLSDKARAFCENCDQMALKDYFGKCESIEEMNKLAEELAEEVNE